MITAVKTGYQEIITTDDNDSKSSKYNYRPYMILVMKTRLRLILRKNEGLRIIGKYDSFTGIADLVVELYINNKVIPLTHDRVAEIETAIEYIKSDEPNHCLVYSIDETDFYSKKLENFIILESKYDHYIHNHNFYANIKDDFENITPTDTAFKKSYQTIHSQFEYFKKHGFTICDKEFADRWNLTKYSMEEVILNNFEKSQIDEYQLPYEGITQPLTKDDFNYVEDPTKHNLFYAEWELNMIKEPFYQFITERLFLLPSIIPINRSSDLFYKLIAEKINRPIFQDNKLVIYLNDYESAKDFDIFLATLPLDDSEKTELYMKKKNGKEGKPFILNNEKYTI